MMDFNEVPVPSSPPGEINREGTRASLLQRLDGVLAAMFPAGRVKRNSFVVGDLLGSPGDSLEVVLSGDKVGLWTDRATGEGGDIFDLIAGHLAIDVHGNFAKVLQFAQNLTGTIAQTSKRTRKD
jgi:putative DNA primase/helicase